MDKKMIRKIMKEKRLSLNEETFLSYNQRIYQKVIEHDDYQKAQMIGIYVSFDKETDTKQIIQDALKKHHVCVPRIDDGMMNFYEIHSFQDLQEGYFHILEPKTNHLVLPSDIDMMIVPLLAFDSQNYRVGYGKAFYDRYFSQGFQGYKLGIGFSFQEVEQIKHDQYDYPLDEILTE